MLFVQLFTQTEKGQRGFGAQLRIFNDICFNKGFLFPPTQIFSLFSEENMFNKFKTVKDENASGDFFVILSSTSREKDLGSLIRGTT